MYSDNLLFCHFSEKFYFIFVLQLVSDRILDSLDFIDFDFCVECVKGMQTKAK